MPNNLLPCIGKRPKLFSIGSSKERSARDASSPQDASHSDVSKLGSRGFLLAAALILLVSGSLSLQGCSLYENMQKRRETQKEVDIYIERLIEIKKAEYDVVLSEITMRTARIVYNQELKALSGRDGIDRAFKEFEQWRDKYNENLVRYHNLLHAEKSPIHEESLRAIGYRVYNSENDPINRFLKEYGYLYVNADTKQLKDMIYFMIQDGPADKKNPLEISSLDRLESLCIGKILSIRKNEEGKKIYTYSELLPFYHSRHGINLEPSWDSDGNEYRKMN